MAVNTDINWRTCDLSLFKTKKELEFINKECTSSAREERVKALAYGVLGAVASVGVIAISILVGKIAGLIIGAVAFPLLIIPPVHALVAGSAGIITGVFVAYQGIAIVKGMFQSKILDHWSHAAKLYERAADARFRLIQLQKS